MSKVFEYLKNLKLPSKVLIGVWIFCMFVVTFACAISTNGNLTSDDTTILLLGYIIFSNFFFVPAIVFDKFIKVRQSERDDISSDKSWGVLFLLCFFFWHLGLHRFYAGKKTSGLVYIFTMGCFGFGYIIDLILILSGKFTDQVGRPIKNNKQNNINKASTYTKKFADEITGYKESFNPSLEDAKTKINKDVIVGKVEKVNQSVKSSSEKTINIQNNNDSSLFTDVFVAGEEEKSQAIPEIDTNAQQAKNNHTSVGVIRIKTSISDDRLTFDFDDDYRYGSNFTKDMAKLENKTGDKAPFVPFMQYWPSYDSMNKQQKNWYFYWRTQVRQSVYLKTDLSYIFIHIYELLSGFGWKNPEDGYNQLLALWTTYRDEHPKLDHYLLNWLFDFAQLHNLEYRIPDCSDVSLPYQPAIRDILIDAHSTEKPLKLSFALIDALCDYSLVNSKFYKEGHQLLMNEAIPRVVALADAMLIKNKGKGILEFYGPKRTKQQSYYAFQGANCINANKRINVSVKGYTSSQKLRSYINELVRYAENILRELYGSRGRLRGVELDDETAKIVKSFLIKEYSPKKTSAETLKKAEVKLDFTNINELRNQSDAVRDALEVSDDSAEQKELLTDIDVVKTIFGLIPQYCRSLINELHSNLWEINYDSSIQPSVDKINEISLKYLACAILVVEGNHLLLEDDYRDEFEFIYNHIDEFEYGDEAKESDNSSMFTVDILSDELKQLIETLSPIQQAIICVILKRVNISSRLEEIANSELSMPEILIDEINDISSQIIGDILIDTFSDEICVLEQYENELKDAMKQED